MPKVSVIIAAYNVEEYISECLKSVYNQTLQDIEIIVCDDSSTDNTLNIVKSIAENESRIKIVANKTNLGTMQNRKSGADIATGEYIMFLDGDDYYAFDACEKAYNAIKNQNVDILQFGTQPFSDAEGYDDVISGVNEYFKCPEERIIVPENGCLLSKKYTKINMNYNLVTKIYSNKIINEAFEALPEERISLGEDLLAVSMILYFSKGIGYISDDLYKYRIGTGISTNKILNKTTLEERAKSYYVYTFLLKWLTEKGVAEICAERLNEIKMQMLDSTVSNIFNVNKQDRQWYIDIALLYCPVEEFIAYASYIVYGLKYIREEEYSKIIKSVKLFKAGNKKVKTIGTFYHRVRNGGIEKVISLLSDIWHNNGYNVIIFTDEEPNKDDYPLNDNAIRVVLPTTNLHTFEEYLVRAKVLTSAIEKYGVDTMVYHAWQNTEKLADISVIKSKGVPAIIHTHGLFCSSLNTYDFEYAYRSSNLSYIYQCVDAVIALNDVDVAWWKSKGLRSYKTINPIEIADKVPPAKLEGKNIIISARIDREQKQIDQAIKIAYFVKDKIPDVKFTFIGGCDDQKYLSEIKEMILTYNLQNNVDMIGYVENVIDYYQKSDVMLSTSRFEGFSLSLTEGKVCGLPLVCYFLANWDMARNPKGMINIPQGDIHAAAEAIIRILSDDTLKKEMGRQARKSGLEFIHTDIGKIWTDIFEDMNKNQFIYENHTEIKEPLVAATDILVEFTAKGLEKRGSTSGFSNQEVIYYQLQCNRLNNTIVEIQQSTSYKIGMIITSIPRRIKMFFAKFFKSGV